MEGGGRGRNAGDEYALFSDRSEPCACAAISLAAAVFSKRIDIRRAYGGLRDQGLKL